MCVSIAVVLITGLVDWHLQFTFSTRMITVQTTLWYASHSRFLQWVARCSDNPTIGITS
jgi:hypothetical protein